MGVLRGRPCSSLKCLALAFALLSISARPHLCMSSSVRLAVRADFPACLASESSDPCLWSSPLPSSSSSVRGRLSHLYLRPGSHGIDTPCLFILLRERIRKRRASPVMLLSSSASFIRLDARAFLSCGILKRSVSFFSSFSVFFGCLRSQREPYDEKIDLWALGVIVYTLIGGYEPFYPPSDCLSVRQTSEGKNSFLRV